MTTTGKDQIFVSYAHADERWLKDLEIRLKPMIRSGQWTVWSDKNIQPGAQWFREIQEALDRSTVAVLLVTPDFLASEFIHQHELTPILNAASQGRMQVLWIPLKASSFEATPLKDFQALSDPSKPLAEMGAERDTVWKRICNAIQQAANPSRTPVDPEVVKLHPAQRVILDLERSHESGELRDSLVVNMVLAALRTEPDAALSSKYEPDWIIRGIRLSDEYLVRVRREAGIRDWQRDFAQVVTPCLIAIAQSLDQSPEAQVLLFKIGDAVVSRLRLQLRWPANDEANELRNRIYRACLNATELESDDVLMAVKHLDVSGPQ